MNKQIANREPGDFWGKKVVKGGPGSGHFGHAGRPGEVGGSAPSGVSALQKHTDYVKEKLANATGGSMLKGIFEIYNNESEARKILGNRTQTRSVHHFDLGNSGFSALNWWDESKSIDDFDLNGTFVWPDEDFDEDSLR